MRHTGRSLVFEDIEDFLLRIDDPALDIDETFVMVLKNCGPKGYPGMAEVGNMPLPPKLLQRGITDMVRISDARMSGTAYGTVVLRSEEHTSELQSLMRISYAVFCLKEKKKQYNRH